MAESFLETIFVWYLIITIQIKIQYNVVPLTSSRSKFNVHIEEDLLPLVLEKMDVTGKDLAKKIMNNLEKVSKAENPYDQKIT
ncbi:hypothetical protein HIL16_15535 [Staphylococcus aureus]|nr:hypothetical protein [Staphylococcus aureus]